jgi:hypothetical protein
MRRPSSALQTNPVKAAPSWRGPHRGLGQPAAGGAARRRVAPRTAGTMSSPSEHSTSTAPITTDMTRPTVHPDGLAVAGPTLGGSGAGSPSPGSAGRAGSGRHPAGSWPGATPAGGGTVSAASTLTGYEPAAAIAITPFAKRALPSPCAGASHGTVAKRHQRPTIGPARFSGPAWVTFGPAGAHARRSRIGRQQAKTRRRQPCGL